MAVARSAALLVVAVVLSATVVVSVDDDLLRLGTARRGEGTARDSSGLPEPTALGSVSGRGDPAEAQWNALAEPRAEDGRGKPARGNDDEREDDGPGAGDATHKASRHGPYVYESDDSDSDSASESSASSEGVGLTDRDGSDDGGRGDAGADPVVVTVAATGDIHGDPAAMLDAIRASGMVRVSLAEGLSFEWVAGPSDRLVFTGDYVDRGPQSFMVLNILYQLESAAGTTPDGEPRVVALLGNHEVTNLLRPESCVRSLAGWVHPLELHSYAGYTGCQGGTRVANGVKRARQRAILSYWGHYKRCVGHLKSTLGTPGKVASELQKMPFEDGSVTARLVGQAGPCPPFSAMTAGDRRLVGDVMEVYSKSWGTGCQLGQWLRRHDIMARIGDAIYMHAGLSSKMLDEKCRWLAASPEGLVASVNGLARSMLGAEGPGALTKSEAECGGALLSGGQGPVWWRPFQALSRPSQAIATRDDVLASLRLAAVNRMVVGHDIHSKREYFYYGADSYSERLEKPFKHTAIIGIDIAMSHYISTYGNIYGDPNSGLGDNIRASVLLTKYHQSGTVTVSQRFTLNGRTELFTELDRIRPEELTDGLVSYGAPPPSRQAVAPRIMAAGATSGPSGSDSDAVTTLRRRRRGQTSGGGDSSDATSSKEARLAAARKEEWSEVRRTKAMVERRRTNLCRGDAKCLSEFECRVVRDMFEMIKAPMADDSANCCDWDGVYCDTVGGVTKVVRLMLPEEGLVGSISPSIIALDKLKVLDLSSNRIYGKFPAQLMDLKELAILKLSDNMLEGAVPSIWSGLTRLRVLDLAGNALVGDIANMGLEGLSLNTLDLSNNRLTGTVPYELYFVHPNAFRGNAVVIPDNKIASKIKIQ